MSISIKEFVAKSISEIHESLPQGYEISDDIEFEITVTSAEGKDGKADLKILQFGGSEKAETAQKIKFTINNPKQQEKNALSEARQIKRVISSIVVGFVKSMEKIKP